MTATCKRILIVDDEPSIRLVLKHALEMPDVIVTTCAGIEKAREIMETTRFELVISDLFLSRGKEPEGLDLMAYISRCHNGTKVVIITGNGSDELREEAFARGASHYHEKQKDIKKLLIKIGSMGIPTKFDEKRFLVNC